MRRSFTTSGQRVRNTSFEVDSSGWYAVNGRLSRVSRSDAPAGDYVARVRRSTSSTYGLEDNPTPVTSTLAGESFAARASVRAASSSSVGKRLVLVVRERNGSTVVAERKVGIYLKSSFAVVSATHVAQRSGSTIDMRLLQTSAGTGDAFDADAIGLVSTPPNATPVAAFRASPTPVTAGDTATLIDTSSDVDGVIASRQWDLDGDGQYDDATGATRAHTFAWAGTHRIGLRVVDDRGAAATASRSFVVEPANVAPTVRIIAGTLSPLAGQTVSFTDGSSDPDDGIASRAWDLDGDGQYDDGTDSTVSTAFPVAGTVSVGLRVADTRGATATAAVDVAVQPAAEPPPPPSSTLEPPPPSTDLTGVEFDGSVDALPDGALGVNKSAFGNWRASVPSTSAVVEVDDGDLGPLRFAGSKTLRYRLPSAVARVELQSADEGSTTGQRDPARTQANGQTQYVSFSFLARSAPQTGSWGWLPIQAKSLISNTHPAGLSPQISLINTGTGSGLRLRTIGGQAGSHVARSTVALSSITPGQWYDVIIGVRAEVTTQGWAKVWIVPKGSALPSEGAPTAQLTGVATNYHDGSQIEPILWRQGLYHATATSGRDLDVLMAPMRRADSFSQARAYFNR